jgi:hypothetical protein
MFVEQNQQKMKNFLLLVLLMISGSVIKADQLKVLSLEEAETVTNFFKNNNINEVVIYYLQDNPYFYINEVNLEIVKRESDNNRYEIHLKGIDVKGQAVEQPIDLAYTYIKKGSSKSVCLGKVFNYDFIQEVQTFDWTAAVSSSRVAEPKEVKTNVNVENTDSNQSSVNQSNEVSSNTAIIYILVFTTLLGLLYFVRSKFNKNKK